ncbi:MAG: permease [Candidatus Hodarchaeales archaeon]
MLNLFVELINGGLSSLMDYLSFHVLLCLVPAFFIAGAMAVFIPKEAVIKYIGKDSPRMVAYPVAALAGFLLAVCSCTVLPLFAGIWKKGAGLGPAITFLFSAPAVNLLALTYTGTLIGYDVAAARAIFSLGFAIILGLIMEYLFENRDKNSSEVQNKSKFEISRTDFTFSFVDVTLVAGIVISGLLIAFLSDELLSGLQIAFNTGVLFISQMFIWLAGLVFLVVYSIRKNTNKRLGLFLWLIDILFTGTSRISIIETNITVFSISLAPSVINTALKTILTLIVSIGTIIYALKTNDSASNSAWMTETFVFFKSIFPYIIIGVFLAGSISIMIPEDFFQSIVGQNTVLANFIGVLFGVFMYFPTLMEVPIARMFLDLGMSRGVLVAYLLADPELSIQSILVTRKYLGDKINTVFVMLVTIATVVAGLIFGLIVSGEAIGLW